MRRPIECLHPSPYTALLQCTDSPTSPIVSAPAVRGSGLETRLCYSHERLPVITIGSRTVAHNGQCSLLSHIRCGTASPTFRHLLAEIRSSHRVPQMIRRTSSGKAAKRSSMDVNDVVCHLAQADRDDFRRHGPCNHSLQHADITLLLMRACFQVLASRSMSLIQIWLRAQSPQSFLLDHLDGLHSGLLMFGTVGTRDILSAWRRLQAAH